MSSLRNGTKDTCVTRPLVRREGIPEEGAVELGHSGGGGSLCLGGQPRLGTLISF